MKQNHRHSTCITLLLSKCPVSDKTLKKRIHQSVLLFLRKDHQASILWLATDLLYIKLFAPARWFWEFRLRNHWTAAMCTFSVPQSPLTIKGQPPNWGAQSIKYCTVIIVSLLEGPTSSHHMCWLYQLMAPWIQKPNSFNYCCRLLHWFLSSQKKRSLSEKKKTTTNRIMWSHFRINKVFYVGKCMQAWKRRSIKSR